MSTDFDPYYKWLAIPPEEQPPNHYRLLGLVAFESDPDVIDGAAEARVAYLRNKQGGKNADASQKILNEVAAARIILLSDEKRAAYDEQLRATTHDPLAPLPVAEVPQPAAFAPAPVASTPLQTGISAKPIRARRKPQPAWVMPAVICGGALFVLTVVCIAAAAMLGGTDPQTASADSSPGISPKPPRVTPPPVTPKPVDPPVDPAPVDPPPVDPPVDPPVEPTPVDPPPADPMPVDPAPSPFDPPPADPDATDPNATDPGATDPGATDPAPVDPPVAEPEKPGKLPVPDSALQQTNQEKMRALFDFKGAKTPAEKLTLASKLGSLADDDGVDAVQRYVLLDAASGLAIEAGHAPTAVEYKRLLAERFEVDPLQTQYDVLMDAAKSFRLGPEIETLVKASMEFISTAMEADRVDLANDVAGATYKLASRRGVAVEARKVAFDQRNQVRDMYASWRKVRDALEGLEATPDDPALNTTAGEYYCFTVGDWQRGIQHLAKSDDTELQPLAKLELDSDGSAEQLKTIGDEWQQLAVKQKGERKIQLLMRSARAYLIAQSIAPPGSDIANALPPIIAKFGDVTQVQNAIIHERRPNGKKVLFIGMGGTERKTAEPAAKRYFVDHHFMKSMDPSKIDFDRYHTIMVGSNGMDYWGNKDRKEPEAFRDYVDFIREGGHLVVFGTFNGRNMEHLKQFGIKTWSTHGSSFVRVGEATDLFFQGAEHLVPESGKLRTAGAFSISTPHTVLLRRDPTKLALATLPVDRGRLTITTCEPNWMGDLWLIKAMVSWVANGTPLPDEVTPDE